MTKFIQLKEQLDSLLARHADCISSISFCTDDADELEAEYDAAYSTFLMEFVAALKDD